jgi:hypothetical protein
MQLPQSDSSLSASFDESNFVSAAGLKVASLVTGMVPGADSIDDIAMLRSATARWASSSHPVTRTQPWVPSCAPSPSGTSAGLTRSPPGS